VKLRIVTAVLVSLSAISAAVGARSGPASGAAPLLVRATAVVAPCVAAAGEAYAASSGRRIAVETGALRPAGAADAVVGTDVEMTRALESGEAVDESEAEIARIPWVLAVAASSPVKITGLEDVERSGLDVAVLDGAEALEARKALAKLPTSRVRATSDAAALRAAPLALVPLSLAGPGARVKTDVRPLVASAAVVSRAARRTEAAAFVRFLASDAGQSAFATCGAARD
jgi:ABC-type molybdate transport system substrate-binding protein